MVSDLSSKNRRKKKCPPPRHSTSLPSAITFTILCPPWNHIALPPPAEALSSFQVESDHEMTPPNHHSSSSVSSSVSPSSEVSFQSTVNHRHPSHRGKKRAGTRSNRAARRFVYRVERRRHLDGTSHALWRPPLINSSATPVPFG